MVNNEIYALIDKHEFGDLLSKGGLEWLRSLELPLDRLIPDNHLTHSKA